MAKKIKAPKGKELKLEAPVKIKGEQLKRDIDEALGGKRNTEPVYYGPGREKKTLQYVKNSTKVKSAFELGKHAKEESRESVNRRAAKNKKK